MNGNCFWLSALMVVVGAGVGRAIESVDFKAAAAGLAASYEEARPGTVTAEEVRWDFNPGAPLFAGFPRLYRGVRVRSSGNTLGEKSTLLRLHDNEPPSWPDRPELFWQPSDTSGAITITWLWFFLFKKSDFAGAPAGLVELPAGSRFRLNILAWWDVPGQDGAWPVQVRFLVNQAGRYYVSEAAYTVAKAGKFILPDVAGTRWAPVTLTAREFGLPSDLQFAPVKLDDVQAVGWTGQGSGTYLRRFAVDEFTVTTP